jgi:hypothetical protein
MKEKMTKKEFEQEREDYLETFIYKQNYKFLIPYEKFVMDVAESRNISRREALELPICKARLNEYIATGR